jgi:hypothetical protein
MKRLNLPVIKGKTPSPRSLSMDDYVKFIDLNLRYTLDRKNIRKYKSLLAVNVPFSLK